MQMLTFSKQWDAFLQIAFMLQHYCPDAMRPWVVATMLPIMNLFPGILTFGAKLGGKIKQVVPSTISTKLTSNEKESTI